MVGQLDGQTDEELTSSMIRLLAFVYQPLIENFVHFDDGRVKQKVLFEELLMAIQSLQSSLRVANQIFTNNICTLEMEPLDVGDPKFRNIRIRNADVLRKAEKIAIDWLCLIDRVNQLIGGQESS
jgi:hypothetical protein